MNQLLQQVAEQGAQMKEMQEQLMQSEQKVKCLVNWCKKPDWGCWSLEGHRVGGVYMHPGIFYYFCSLLAVSPSKGSPSNLSKAEQHSVHSFPCVSSDFQEALQGPGHCPSEGKVCGLG